jgi:transposase-like protein
MATIARKSDGRRIFTDEFKRKHIDRVWRGDLTLTELSQKLGIARSLLQRWKRMLPQGDGVVGEVRARPGPASELRAAQMIRELQVIVGKQTVSLELLRLELDECMKRRRPLGTSRL